MRKFLLLVFIFIILVSDQNKIFATGKLSIVVLPTINNTGLEIWESKFYPRNILEKKMTEYLEILYKRSPNIEVRALDQNGMNRWLSSSRRGDDMAVQIEMYEAILKDRHLVGNVETGRVQIRLKVFDTSRVREVATRTVQGKDTRFTFDSPEDIFWLDAGDIISMPIPFKDGLDILGLTEKNYSQKMSRLTWDQFKGSSHWQAIKNAIDAAYRESMKQINNARQSNNPNPEMLADNFSTSFQTVGKILAPTANSKRHKREYIISLGSSASGFSDSVNVGDILDVVRPDTYITVVPENPVVVIPKVIGKVKVTKVYDNNAIVRVIRDDKKEPITLKDIVIKNSKMIGK